MEAVRTIRKKYCSQAMVAAVAGAVLMILVGEKAIGKGLVLGTLFSVVNFVLMAHFIPRTMAGSRAMSSAAAFGSILLRFALLAVPLVVSLRVESVHIIGVVIGLFMVQLTLMFDHFVRRRFSSIGNT
ncbi:MAG: ATP synthase subunit I [Deltaproteobacteria bacterium]|nr:ATP synthase subunit I [Deltaproteobacteria bacterium]